ncbi:MAG: hypothetical protein K6C13_02700 [Oscillospiraceae bacterium]|nr:hypothetical protein [Oscillospiraceae bacterium]
MKKTTALLTIAALILTMSACGNQAAAPADTKAAEQTTAAAEQASETTAEKTAAKETTAETTTTEATTAKPEQNKSGFKKDATIDETVLIDEDGIKVTAKELTYSKYAASLELTLENNSDKDITLMSGTLGYSCNSVNGMMFSGGYFNSDVKAGKKTKESVTFKYEDLLIYGIDEIADIELGIYSSPGGLDYTYYPVSQIKTSAAGTYNYDASAARKALNSSEMQSDKGYTVKYFAEDALYDVDDVSIVSETLFENRDGDPMLLVEVVNNSAYQSRISIDNIAINGVTVCSSRWTSELINPGKTAFIDINLASAFEKQYWDMFGITDIKSIKLGIGQSDREGKNESKPETIVIPVSGSDVSADTSGTVAYDQGGVRVIYKGIAGGRYDFDKDLYMMMLVENTSGKKIYIDEDNVSINGFMVDTMAFSTDVEDGDCVVWKIEIYESSLEDCDVKDASDIEEIEFTVEIRDEHWSNQKEGEVSLKLS